MKTRVTALFLLGLALIFIIGCGKEGAQSKRRAKAKRSSHLVRHANSPYNIDRYDDDVVGFRVGLHYFLSIQSDRARNFEEALAYLHRASDSLSVAGWVLEPNSLQIETSRSLGASDFTWIAVVFHKRKRA